MPIPKLNVMNTLPSQISGLSVAEKFDLLDALWEDIEAQAPALSEEQTAELDRRMAKYQRDPSIAIPWEQVKADLRSR
jgi:putative addiction module component (TIGR02574 family)